MKKKHKKGKILKYFSNKKNYVMADHQNDPIQEQYPNDAEVVKKVALKLEIAASTPQKNNIHIIARGKHWIIKREGALKAYRIYETIDQAIKNAKEMLEKGLALSIIIHDDDGSVSQRI